MKTKLFLAFATLLAFLQAKSQTGTYVPQLAAFDTAMINLLNQYNVPGGELAITYKGRLVYNRAFGYADVANNIKVEPNNIFRLASVSKPITSVAIMKLYEQGLIHLNDTVFGVHGILNDNIYQSILDSRVKKITVRNLLTHSGGWNSSVSGDPMFNAYAIAVSLGVSPPASATDVIRYTLAHQMLDFAPGTQYQYSNFGFCILGRVIEKITGQNYETYVLNSVLNPIGITDMHTGKNLKADKLPNEVLYYDYPNAPFALSVYDYLSAVPWPYGGFNIEAMDSHGGWVASAADLCKFLVSIDGFSTKPDILSTSTINTMVSPSATNVNYAFGWNVNSANNWWHLGSLPGTVSEIVRSSNQLNWAILLNTRPANSDPLASATDNLVWSVLSKIKTWPSNDQFTTETGINEIPENSGIDIYPNPSRGKLTISFSASNNEVTSLEILNSLGQVILKQKVTNSTGTINLNLSSYPDGAYMVRTLTNSKPLPVRKFMITK